MSQRGHKSWPCLTDLGLPVSITGGDLTLNLTGIASELLAGLVP